MWNFHSPKLRFDITSKSSAERKTEQTKTDKFIDEHRALLIDAAIVRVMKMRRTLNYQTLIVEVLQQLASKFKPKVGNMKVHTKLLNSFYVHTKKLCDSFPETNWEAHWKGVYWTWFTELGYIQLFGLIWGNCSIYTDSGKSRGRSWPKIDLEWRKNPWQMENFSKF